MSHYLAVFVKAQPSPHGDRPDITDAKTATTAYAGTFINHMTLIWFTKYCTFYRTYFQALTTTDTFCINVYFGSRLDNISKTV